MFLLLFREKSPSPAPVWGPSRRREFSIYFSSVSLSHGQQSSRKCSNVDHRLQSFKDRPQGHRSCQKTCSSLGCSLHRSARSVLQQRPPVGSQPPPQHPPALKWVSSTGCRWISASPQTSIGCRVTAASPWGAEGSQLQHLEHLLPLLIH